MVLIASPLVLRAPAAPGAPPTSAPPRTENQAAYVPAQCYATTSTGGVAHDSCSVCHRAGQPPNFVDDSDLVTTRSFPAYARENHWRNALAAPPEEQTSDDEVLAAVRAPNLGSTRGCRFDFDEEGFDRDGHGGTTGWRAYAYVPFPGMFWPTNGSAGDAFVRLPVEFREDLAGQPSREVHRLNLAILEAYVTRTSIPIPPIDERTPDVAMDVDGDGRLAIATQVSFVWPPPAVGRLGWAGRAKTLDPTLVGLPSAGLYPRGTELLHTVRYLDVKSGRVVAAARVKEVRYLRKVAFLTYSDLDQAAAIEAREEVQNPDRLEKVRGDATSGVGTGKGWLLQAEIEDVNGALRPQTYEELSYCVGCHAGIGATVDGTFSFARKLGPLAPAGGWYQQGTRSEPVAERVGPDGVGEYTRYLAAVGGGDDFRTNDEVKARFFRPDGTLDLAAARAFAHDVDVLILPSPRRALALDRAYLGRVAAQSFTLGREVLVGDRAAIERRFAPDESTGIVHSLREGTGAAQVLQ